MLKLIFISNTLFTICAGRDLVVIGYFLLKKKQAVIQLLKVYVKYNIRFIHINLIKKNNSKFLKLVLKFDSILTNLFYFSKSR